MGDSPCMGPRSGSGGSGLHVGWDGDRVLKAHTVGMFEGG